MRDPADTIAAIATPKGFGARCIIRISGPEAWQAVCRVCVLPPDQSIEPAHPKIISGELSIKGLNHLLPCDVYYWPPGRSYTGQAAAEIHMLVCQPLAEAVLAQLETRPAEPGEFTMRAFLSGRIDLTQAEAVLGVIDAARDDDLKAALQQLAGGLANPLRTVREDLLDLLAELEIGFDYVEEDLPFLTWDQLTTRIADAHSATAGLLERLSNRRLTDELPTVVITGRPNAGKSALFNALAGDSRAIVSPVPGTTRDYLTAVCHFEGIDFQLVDTAGIENLSQLLLTENAECESVPTQRVLENEVGQTFANRQQHQGASRVESQAQLKTRLAARFADLRLVCLDVSQPLQEEELEFLSALDQHYIVVLTKADLQDKLPALDINRRTIVVSATKGIGLDELKATIVEALWQAQQTRPSVLTWSAARCRAALAKACEALAEALQLATSRAPEETVAAGVRAALEEIGCVIGTVYTEDLLDRIFSRFCVGK